MKAVDVGAPSNQAAGIVGSRSMATRGRPSAHSWAWAQWLALAGIPILVLHVWTMVAWLSDGPHQITQFRHGRTADWYAARVVEGTMIVISVAVLIAVVRRCRRERRLFTFDVMFCLVGATLTWADLGVNVFHPVLMINSNFVNLNNPCGHMPLVVNPDCGQTPTPILFFWLLEAFGTLGILMLFGAVVRRARKRWPDLSTMKVIAILVVGGVAVALLEPVTVALHLWSYPGAPLSLSVGDGMRWPWLFSIPAFVGWLVPLAALRIFKDDRGQTVVERGLERHSPLMGRAISLGAMYTLVQLIVWIPGTVPLWGVGFYARQWPKVPAEVLNDVCDAPGTNGTRYGPCPGSPGYRMPGRHSLPGRSP